MPDRDQLKEALDERDAAYRARDEAVERARKIAGERDALLASQRHLHAERDDAIAAASRYRATLCAKLIREAAESSLARHGASQILRPHLEQQLRVEEDTDGKLCVSAVDDVGQRSTVDKLVQAMRVDPDYAKAFRAREEPSNKLANNPWTQESWHLTQQAQLLRENPGLARRMQIEAGVLHDDTTSRKKRGAAK